MDSIFHPYRIALVIFCIPGEQVDSRLHRRDPEYKVENPLEIQNAVTIYNPVLGEYETAKINTTLSPGSRVKTSSIGTGEVRLIDGSIVRLSEKTEVQIQSIHTNPWQGVRIARFHTLYGDTYVDTGSSGNIFIFTKGQSETVIEGRALMTENSVIPLDTNSDVSVKTSYGTVHVKYGKKAEVTNVGGIIQSDVDPSDFAEKTKRKDAPLLSIDNRTITTNEKDIVITGKSDPGITISIREFTTRAGEDGRFELTFVNHPIGSSKHPVRATDAAGRETIVEITITRSEEYSHMMEVINPAGVDLIQTDESSIKIDGLVRGSSLLTVNGDKVEYSGESFSYEFELRMGISVIEIKSIGMDGHSEIIQRRRVKKVESLPEAEIEIVYPKELESTTRSSSMTIRGTTNTDFVYYKSDKIVVEDGMFEFEASLEYGINTIAVEAKDLEHKAKSVDIIIEREREDIKSLHVDGVASLTNNKIVIISGRVQGANSLKILGLSAQINTGGYFKESITLVNEGINEITVTAQYSDGTSSQRTVNITLDTTPPDLSRLKATRNPDGGITVQGMIEEIVTFLSINGEDQTQQIKDTPDDRRSVSILHEIDSYDSNFVEVKATDKAGNTSARNIPVEDDTN